MANCLTCVHQEVCKERMAIFNLPNIVCQYEAHELVGEWIEGVIGYHYCSKCRNYALASDDEKEVLSEFCPYCGASMRKEGEAE